MHFHVIFSIHTFLYKSTGFSLFAVIYGILLDRLINCLMVYQSRTDIRGLIGKDRGPSRITVFAAPRYHQAKARRNDEREADNVQI
jgi:hypothetical protein